MRSQARKLALALLATLAGAGLCAAPSGAQIPFVACAHTNDFGCAHLTVPLDPSGVAPGSLTLDIHRHLAPVGSARSAVVALAGGPGQSALPFTQRFTEVLGPILATRDLIVYDQRGTGRSHPLSCHGLEQPSEYHSTSGLVAACATQIGAERAFYTTPDSVADIEAIRRAGGYEKLVLYGTSYGTKVALEYAQEYPEHVEALVLDSTVTPGGPDPLERPTFAAVPRILRQLCEFHGCAHITRNPVADLARLVRRMSRELVVGRVIDGHGHPYREFATSSNLIGILVAGDFEPISRAEFIGAVRSAVTGDDAALARLLARAAHGGRHESEGIDIPLYLTTSCEEQAFPWNRAATPHARLKEALATFHALPASTFAPFTSSNALTFSDIGVCAFWPFATPAPPVLTQPLPDVPTLILSGADDLRTPTSGARAVAAQIPDAHVVVVPDTGHAVLASASNPCARRALQAEFAGKPVAPCAPTPPPPFLKPTPLAPPRLTDVAPAHGYSGRPGRTLQAVKLTVADFGRQLILTLLEAASSPHNLLHLTLRTGGLRAGWAQATSRGLNFHHYSYIPGVTLTGVVKTTSADLHIGGSAAARGTLRLGPHRALVGTLGGRHVRITRAEARASAARSTSVNPSPAAARLPSVLARLQTQIDELPAGFGEALSALPQLWASHAAAAL